MATVLQEIKERLEKEIKFINKDDSREDRYYQSGLKSALNICNEFIEKEKKQIIDAYCRAEDRSEFFEYEHRYGREYLTAEDYYNEQFNCDK